MPSKTIVDFANQVKSYALGIKDQQGLGAWNLLPIMVASQSINNVSFTVNSDKSITAHRTATSSSSSLLYLADNYHVFTLPKGKYYLSDGKPENSEAWVFVSLVNGTTIIAQNIATTENGEAEFDTSPYTYDKMYIGVRISKDQTEDVTFKSMISTQPNHPYVPYAMTNRELTDTTQGKTISSVDLNNIVDTGLYLLNGSLTHSPGPNYGYMLVIKFDSTNIKQIMYPYSESDKLFIRTKYQNTWTSWYLFAGTEIS